MFKKTVIVSIGVFILLMGLVVYGFYSIAFGDFAKRFIISNAYYRLGVKLNIEEIKVSYFYPSITLTGVTVNHNKDGISVFGKAESVNFSFKPFQMIGGRISIHSVTLKSSQIVMKVDSIPDSAVRNPDPPAPVPVNRADFQYR